MRMPPIRQTESFGVSNLGRSTIMGSEKQQRSNALDFSRTLRETPIDLAAILYGDYVFNIFQKVSGFIGVWYWP